MAEEPVENEYVYEYAYAPEPEPEFEVIPPLIPSKRRLLPGEAPFDPPGVPVSLDVYPEEQEEEILVEYPTEVPLQPVHVPPVEVVAPVSPPLASSRVIVRRAEAPPFGRPRGPLVEEGFAPPPLRPMH